MNNINYIGVIVSFVFVFLVIYISETLKNKKVLSKEGTRKFIHIGVSNWWFIFMFLFDNIWMAIIPPVVFTILNYISYKKNIIKTMERDENNSLGTIYFPISLLIAVIMSFVINDKVMPGIGILVLGYGDGFAAWIGSKFKSKVLNNNKTITGSLTMFIVSFIVIFIMMMIFKDIKMINILLITLITSTLVTIIELLTPKGLDNITVPLSVIGILYLLI